MPPQNTDTLVPQTKQTNGGQIEVVKAEKTISPKAEFDPNEIVDTAAVIVPPDGGWGWVVMVASFLCNTVVDGIVFSSGMFQEKIAEEFEVSRGYIALVSSLLSGFYLMAGPFVSALANKFGFRPVTIVGAFVASFGFGISYYATSVEYLFISYGVVGGIGFCLIYIPSVISIGYYFERWRALATGIALCGSGVGTFVFAPLSAYLIENFRWRISFVIQAAIILSCAIFGSAYRPIKPIEIPLEDKPEENDNLLQKNKKLPTGFSKPLPEGRFAYSVPNSAHNTYMGTPSNNLYPTAAEVFRGSAANLERRLSATSGAAGSAITSKAEQKRRSQPTTPNGESVPQPNFNLNLELTTVGENEEDAESNNLLTPELKPTISAARRHTVSGRRPNDQTGTKTPSRVDPTTDARPMYRDDIFFTGSLVRIPQYTSQTSLGYHMSVTRLPTKQDLIEQREKKCKLCPEAVRRTLSTMLDTSLLKSPSFMLLATSGFLTMMGFFVPFIYINPRANAAEMDPAVSQYLISAIGVSNTIARIGCGVLSSFKAINALHLNNVAITAGGIATIFSGYVISGTSQFIFAAIFGICIACFSALRSIIAVDLMGLEKLTNAFGFLMLFQGIAAAIGAPIAGMFYDKTNSYDASFQLAGSLILISAVLCYPLNYVSKWEKEREAKKNGAKPRV